MSKKGIILLIMLLLLLVSVTNASEVSDSTGNSPDSSNKIVQDTANNVKSSPVEQKTIKKIESNEKNIKTTSNIYVSSNGKGNGETPSTPTNMTYALSLINNKDVINLVTNSTEDKYTSNIRINTESVKSGTDTFSIIGQSGKNIEITSTLNITDMNVNIKNINFTGTVGNASIESHNSSLTVDNCTFTHDKKVTLNFDASTIEEYREVFYTINEYVDNSKGAVYNTGDNLVINNCLFQDNYLQVPEISGISISLINHVLELYGAAIYNTGNNPRITNNKFENNHVIESSLFQPSNYWWERNEIHGGAIYNTGNSPTIQNNTFIENSASDYGGAIYNTGTNAEMTNNIFENNEAQYGGAICNQGNNSTISHSSFKGNKAYDSGAIDNRASNVKIMNSNFTQNQAKYVAAAGSYHCNNTIISYNIFKQNKANNSDCNVTIEVEESNVIIKNNIEDSKTKYNQTIRFYNSNGFVTYNKFTDESETNITISPTKGKIRETINITASFYQNQPITGGKAIFKVNGKTLRYDNGEVIYADVINGRAELPDVNITQEWMKPDTTIQAVYIGDNNNEPIVTEKTQINVTKPEATITLEAPTEATAGTTITLKATVTDGENNINSGRVAFKLNGKTLKNAEGKALYINVENCTATTTYTIPAKTKAKEYTLTAVFTDTAYDRVEAETSLSVVKD